MKPDKLKSKSAGRFVPPLCEGAWADSNTAKEPLVWLVGDAGSVCSSIDGTFRIEFTRDGYVLNELGGKPPAPPEFRPIGKPFAKISLARAAANARAARRCTSNDATE